MSCSLGHNAAWKLKFACVLFAIAALPQSVNAAANIVATTPAGWSAPIVVATNPGSITDSNSLPPYSTANNLFVSFAVTNNGDVTSGPISIILKIDGTQFGNPFNSGPLAVGAVFTVNDVNIGQLSHTTHAIEIAIGSTSLFIKTIQVKYPVPVITSGASPSAVAGSQFSYRITASGSATFFNTSPLPTWLQLDGSGLIFGTPPLTAAGPADQTYQFTVQAGNGDFNGTLAVTLTVHPAPPIITSPLRMLGTLGVPFSYTVTYTGSPSNVTTSTFPVAGLIGGGAAITGTPDQSGTIIITMIVQNSAGLDTKLLQIDILGPPLFTSDLNISGATGQTFTYQMLATGSPFFYAIGTDVNWGIRLSDLALNLNPDTGIISGVPSLAAVPAGASTFTFPIFATSIGGSGTATLVIGIQRGTAPAITSNLIIHGYRNLQFYYKALSTPAPSDAKSGLTYKWIGVGPDGTTGNLPAGLRAVTIVNCDPNSGALLPPVFTGEIDGTPSVKGIFPGDVTGTTGVAMQVSYVDKNNVTQTVIQPLTFFIDGSRSHITSSKNGLTAKVGAIYAYNGTSVIACPGFATDLATAAPAFPGAIDNEGTQNKLGIGYRGVGPAQTLGVYWEQLDSCGSIEADPWPYLPIGLGSADIPAVPPNCPGKQSPSVPFSNFTMAVGVTQNVTAGLSGPGITSTYYIASDGVTLNPIPIMLANGTLSYMPAGVYPLSAIGLGVTAPGVIGGSPTVAGVFFITVKVTDSSSVGACGYPTLTGFGVCSLKIEHIKTDQPIILSPNVINGQLDTDFLYTFKVNQPNYALNAATLADLALLPPGLSFTGGGVNNDVTITGKVSTTDPNLIASPNWNAATGVYGPVGIRIRCSTPVGLANTFYAPDTQDRNSFTLTVVFWDKNPLKPQIASAPVTVGSELVPTRYNVIASQNSGSITAVTQYITPTGMAFPKPPGGAGLPGGLKLAATVGSQALMTGILQPGTSEYYPGEVMRPKDQWVLFKAKIDPANPASPEGYGDVKIVADPAPPNISYSIDTGKVSTSAFFPGGSQNWLTFMRNMGYEATQTVGLRLSHIEFTSTGFTLLDGFRVFAPNVGIAQNGLPVTADYDGFWDKYIVAPYFANPPLYYGAQRLPGGQAIDKSTPATKGLITGDLTTVQTLNVQINAQSQTGADTRTLQVGVEGVKITSSRRDNATVGIPYRYQIVGTGIPNTFFAKGLPPGLTIDPRTGIIGGVPLVPSDPNNPINPTLAFPVTIQASNAYDTGQTTLCLRVAQVANSPVITSPATATGSDGQPFTYKITATVPNPNSFVPPVDTSVTSFDATPLPLGLSIDKNKFLSDGVTPNPNFGVISGAPIGFGIFDVILTAGNTFGQGGKLLHLTINPVLPNLTSPLSVTGIVGLPFTYTITGTGSQAITYSTPDPTVNPAFALPAPLTLSGADITGIPAVRGVFNVIITASNPAGSVQFTLVITIYERPQITNTPLPLAATVIVGLPFKFVITVSGSPEQLVVTASSPPPGIQFDGQFTIAGVPTTPGIYPMTLQVTNITGPLYTQQSTKILTITVQAMQITSSPLLITGIVGVPITPFQITATGNPTGFSAPGLPRALTINTATGLITGIPIAAGTTSVQITATNGVGSATTSLIVAISAAPGVPAITSPLTASGVVKSLVPFAYTITATNNPTIFNAVPVDPTITLAMLGLTIDPKLGLITGKPLLSGTYPITISATNANGTGSAVLILGISTVPGAPAIISQLTATALAGAPFSYQIIGSNTPTTYGATINGNSIGTIGLTVDPKTGFISGKPLPAGIYNIVISASNSGGTGQAVLVLTVLPPQVPSIQPPLTASGTVGLPFFYVINANGFPQTFGATPLPPGLTVDINAGIIQGIPLLAGTFNVTLSATNFFGTGSATLVLTITQIPGTPIITSPLVASGTVGAQFLYQITATNVPTSFNALFLPPGLTVSATTGLISGVPKAAGVYSVILEATNSVGLGTALLTMTIAVPPPPPVITGANDLVAKVITPNVAGTITVNEPLGVPMNLSIIATNTPTGFTAGPIPPNLGLNFDGLTGLLSGTPLTLGSFTMTVTASNAGGTATATLVLNIVTVPPVITIPLTATGSVGADFILPITATGTQPMVFTALPLPPGLTLTGNVIGGRPTVAGVYTVTLTATNSLGTDTKVLVITIVPPTKPIITSPLTATGIEGAPFTYNITATGSQPIIFSAASLPGSLAVVGSQITGILPPAGTYAIQLTAANSAGSDTQTLVLTVTPLIPGVDTDGDGFPDEIEVAAGSDPLDPNSTPFDGQPAGPAQQFFLNGEKFQVKLNFVKPNMDTITLNGTLPVNGPFSAPGQRIIVDVAGVVRVAVIGNNGSATTTSLKSKFKVKGFSPLGPQNVKFSIRMNGTFSSILAYSNLTKSPIVKSSPRTLYVIILLNKTFYKKIVTLSYTTNGKTGAAR